MTFFLVRAQCALVAATLLAAAPATLAAQTRAGSALAPATLWAAQNTPRELTLVWDSVAGAKSFRLYRGSGESAQVIARPEARVLRWHDEQRRRRPDPSLDPAYRAEEHLPELAE